MDGRSYGFRNLADTVPIVELVIAVGVYCLRVELDVNPPVLVGGLNGGALVLLHRTWLGNTSDTLMTVPQSTFNTVSQGNK